MKEWKAPELKELGVSNTKDTYVIGKNPDGEKIETCWGWEIPLKSDPIFSCQPGIKH